MEPQKLCQFSKLPALGKNQKELKSPGKDSSPLKTISKRQKSIQASRINDETSSPELALNSQYTELKLAPLHPKPKKPGNFNSAKIEEKFEDLSFEENENECFKDNESKIKAKENLKHSQSPNKNKPSRFLPKDSIKEPKKPQLHAAIKALEKGLGDILESKISKIQSDALNERIQKLAPFRRRRSRYLSDIIKN